MPARKKILLVDDSVTVLLMERMLFEGPYELLSATSGEEAMRLALAERPDLILMDVVMPGMDGIETCRRLRAEPVTRGTPIVLITTRGGIADMERGYMAGCNEYLTKPVNTAELTLRVACLLGG